MESSIDISNELKTISPAIAAIQKQNVFTVPAGYFDSFPAAVLIHVKEATGSLFNSSQKTSGTVPPGYFESLADNILDKIKAQQTVAEELAALSPVIAAISNKNIFTVPVGYFESLAGDVLYKTAANNTAATELRELSAMLYSIQNENVFTVPRGYFESLPQVILDKVQPQPAKLVTMKTRHNFSIIKYAVAAMFTGVMALAVYEFTNTAPVSITKTAELGNIEKTGLDIAKTNKFDEEFSKVTDDDIIKYLQTNGTDVDAALVAANIVDEKELPSQEDYLTDDKALDKYLDNVDLKDLKN